MGEDKLYAMRHSLAHIMATAVQQLWPDAKFGVGPVVEHGFYYDIDLGETKISEQQFNKIEKIMRRIIAEKQDFVCTKCPIDEAIQWAKDNHQPYKEELLNDLKRAGTTVAKDLDAAEMGTITEGDSALDEVSFYTNGSFRDLCRGPHVANTSEVGAFKLMRVAGAYWRGNEKNPQMQRLYGVAFATQEELDEYLKKLELAKQRDHRKLGKELDLYTTSPLVGVGLPLFTPRGTILRDIVAQYSNQLRQRFGFEKVWTPHITKKDLYETSGHWAKFGEELFLVKSQETSDEMALKPMNCPHHIEVYKNHVHSYRELPIRIAELGMMHRFEKSGALSGLQRVREMTLNDSHLFVMPEQIQEEFKHVLDLMIDVYKDFNITDYRFRLSYRDPNDKHKYFDNDEMWENAQRMLKSAMDDMGLDYFEAEGEAAFYGPKLDIQVKTALGKEETLSTIQLDFLLPERFDLKYIGADGEEHRPVMIHRGVISTMERFTAILIENYKGAFPTWLAPHQVTLIPVSNEKHVDYAWEVAKKLRDRGVRADVDERNEKMQFKIRASQTSKIPYQLIVGDKEMEDGTVNVRRYGQKETETMPVDAFVELILADIANKSRVEK